VRHTPIRQKGRRGLENDRIRTFVWGRVLARVPAYQCDGCGERYGLEWAHLFGRPGSGFCLGPWANSAELTTKLCRQCHNTIDRHLDEGGLAHKLRWAAMGRLVNTIAGTRTDGAPYEGIRVFIVKAEETGWTFDEKQCRLIKVA